MSKETNNPAANITAATLASMLQKSSTAEAKTTAKEEAPKSEPAKPEGQPIPETEENQETTPSTEEKAQTPETTAEEQPAEEPETPEESSPEPKEGLPEELKQAIDDAKANGEKGKASLLKRVHKLTNARDTEKLGRIQALQEIEKLNARVKELETQPQQTATIEDVDTPEIANINKELSRVESILNWCDSHSEGGELPDGKGGTITFTPEQVRHFERNAELQRVDLVSQRNTLSVTARQAQEVQRTALSAKAREIYPWLNNPNSPEALEAAQIRRNMPKVAAMPGGDWIIARYLEGVKAEQARLSKAKTPAKPAPKAPQVVTSTPATATRISKPNAEKSAAEENFEKTGKTSDLAKVFAARTRKA